MSNTSENITDLKPNEIFCFGSNFSGQHIGGAAKLATEKFGAQFGVGEGLTGCCYAFPTLNENMTKRNAKELDESKQRLYWTAQQNPDFVFLVTKVGTGIASQPKQFMRELFAGPHPKNITLPEEWETNHE